RGVRAPDAGRAGGGRTTLPRGGEGLAASVVPRAARLTWSRGGGARCKGTFIAFSRNLRCIRRPPWSQSGVISRLRPARSGTPSGRRLLSCPPPGADASPGPLARLPDAGMDAACQQEVADDCSREEDPHGSANDDGRVPGPVAQERAGG